MNVERWIKARNDSWVRLEQLLMRIGRSGLGSLQRTELQELGLLYRTVSSDLSRARAMKLGQDMQLYLNNLVVKAHNQVYQRRINRGMVVLDFFVFGFPALVRKYGLYVVSAFLIFLAPFLVSYTYSKHDVHFGQMVWVGGPLVEEELWPLIEHKQMWTDGSQGMSGIMASEIYTNNIKVSLLAFAFGITFGIGTFFVLLTNGLKIGAVLGVCDAYHMADKLLAFTASHGVLELTAIFISGGSGLLLGSSLLFPGQLKRLDSIRMVAKDAMKLFAGCVPLLLIAGLIEGFISPRTDLNANAKLWITAATACGLLFYLLVPLHTEKQSEN
ncbi:MAG TPA: stage II sporulation protein M [Oculatellaceae cyanobacterium]